MMEYKDGKLVPVSGQQLIEDQKAWDAHTKMNAMVAESIFGSAPFTNTGEDVYKAAKKKQARRTRRVYYLILAVVLMFACLSLGVVIERYHLFGM